jgi:hypothetical protein
MSNTEFIAVFYAYISITMIVFTLSLHTTSLILESNYHKDEKVVKEIRRFSGIYIVIALFFYSLFWPVYCMFWIASIPTTVKHMKRIINKDKSEYDIWGKMDDQED